MRSTSQPLTIITAHTGPVSQVQFHPTATEHLFTCGLDGQILHWDASSSAKSSTITSLRGSNDSKISYFNCMKLAILNDLNDL